jgi:hypothetical protein
MSGPPNPFQSLTSQLDVLVPEIHKCKDAKERAQLLRRMKVLIDQIDALNLSSLKRDEWFARKTRGA